MNNEQRPSVREVTRKHSPLPECRKVNNYICGSCHLITKTVDIHAGTTPMFINCPECGAQSTSTFYKDYVPAREASHEWYYPTLKEALKLRKNPPLLDHVLMGGLLMRAITPPLARERE